MLDIQYALRVGSADNGVLYLNRSGLAWHRYGRPPPTRRGLQIRDYALPGQTIRRFKFDAKTLARQYGVMPA